MTNATVFDQRIFLKLSILKIKDFIVDVLINLP